MSTFALTLLFHMLWVAELIFIFFYSMVSISISKRILVRLSFRSFSGFVQLKLQIIDAKMIWEFDWSRIFQVGLSFPFTDDSLYFNFIAIQLDY